MLNKCSANSSSCNVFLFYGLLLRHYLTSQNTRAELDEFIDPAVTQTDRLGVEHQLTLGCTGKSRKVYLNLPETPWHLILKNFVFFSRQLLQGGGSQGCLNLWEQQRRRVSGHFFFMFRLNQKFKYGVGCGCMSWTHSWGWSFLKDVRVLIDGFWNVLHLWAVLSGGQT